MTELNQLNGPWRGMAVMAKHHFTVHVSLQFDGDTFLGKYETHQMEGGKREGEITGSLTQTTIVARTSTDITFAGSVILTLGGIPMISGSVQMAGAEAPFGTAAFFPLHEGDRQDTSPYAGLTSGEASS